MEDSFTKIEASDKKYQKGPAGKATQERYQKSQKGKDAKRRYFQTEKGKMAVLKYYLSEKGKSRRRAKGRVNSLLSACNKFLEENPTKTVEDFLAQLGETNE